MGTAEIVELVLSLVLLFASAFFSLAETAFTCLNKYRFEVMAAEGKKSAKAVLFVVRFFDASLITILIGNNAASVALSLFSTALFLKWIPGLSDSLVSLLASIVTTLLVYVLAETTPKQIAKRIPNKCATFSVYPLLVLFVLLFPLTMVFFGISKLGLLLFRSKEEPELTEEDVTSALDENEKQGALDENDNSVIQNSFDFGDTRVSEVLTPRDKIFSIDLKGLTKDQLKERLLSTSYSRIPLTAGNPDEVVGVLIVKTYLAELLRNPDLRPLDAMEKPYVVTPDILLDDLVEGFRKSHTEMALVYQGKTLVGLITMEDVLEELVGEIAEKGSN